MSAAPPVSVSFACITPEELRTEYLTNPLGLDVPHPRFSWKLRLARETTDAARQSGYQIRVVSTSRATSNQDTELWDSGEVESSETTFITYGGRPLAPGLACHWSVRVRDANSRWSEWSAPARFTMGLLVPSDWTARWIGTGESFTCDADLSAVDRIAPPDNQLPDPWFRRSFVLESAPRRATAFVASVGFHELHVNGTKVGDAVLMPSVTDNSQRARYVTYDVTSLLRTGENVIGLWLGTGWSIFPVFEMPGRPRAPLVMGQFHFEFADGGVGRLETDRQWLTHPSSSRLLGIWYFMNFGGERLEAARELPLWAEPGLDESDWKPAVEFEPDLIVSADKVEPNRLLTELSPVEIKECAGGGHRIDMGRNFAGWTEIKVSGRPGDEIEFMFSERPDEPITYRIRSLLVLDANGRGVFRNRFNYSSGRWIQIRGLRQKPEARDIRGWLVRTDFAPGASFTCSHALFNRIHEATRWTLENLTLGGYIVDCPQRERMGYGGDGHATITTALSLFDFGAFCTKWSEDWRDVEGRASIWGHMRRPNEAGGGAWEEGNVPYTAPTYWGGGGPIWSGFCVHLPWETYRRYGDKDILRANYPLIRAWLGFLENKARDNLLRRWGGEWDFLGDWLWPESAGVNGDTRESLFLNNCYWIYILSVASEIADILGHGNDAIRWREHAATIRTAVHNEFYNPADHSYVNGFQAKLALALLADVPPPELREKVWKRLEHEILVVRRGHIHAGITGGAMLFKMLMEAGRDDLIYEMVDKEDFPSWGHMLRNGATTLWEAWVASDSLLHSSFIYVGAWFINGVLGIQPHPRHPGFSEFVIRPGLVRPPHLTSASGHYDSIRGRIAVDWKWHDDIFRLDLTVPPNTRATVHIPTDDPNSVRERGQVPQLKRIAFESGRLILEVEPGSYNFSAALTLGASPKP